MSDVISVGWVGQIAEQPLRRDLCLLTIVGLTEHGGCVVDSAGILYGAQRPISVSEKILGKW